MIGRSRQQDALAVVLGDVVMNGAVRLRFAVTEIMALVYDYNSVAAQVGKASDCSTNRRHLGNQAIVSYVTSHIRTRFFGQMMRVSRKRSS